MVYALLNEYARKADILRHEGAMETGTTQPIKLFIVGDLVPTSHHAPFFQDLQFAEAYNDILDLTSRHDINIANLECPLTGSKRPIRKAGPHMRARPESVLGIHHLGFNLLSLANNHIKDMGDQGIADTIQALNTQKIGYVGAGHNLGQSRKPFTADIREISLGILAITENEFSIATAASAGANPLDLFNNYQDIVNTKKKCDFLIVIYHGGNEFYRYPNPEMQKACRLFVEFGADAVVCHHSHVTSGHETYKNSPIFYGLGNFIFDHAFKDLDDWYFGCGVSLTFSSARKVGYELHPFIQGKYKPGLRILRDDEKTEAISRIQQLSAEIQNDDILSARWKDFVKQNTPLYMSRIKGHNRIERFLEKSGFPVFWKENPRAFRNLANYFRCEAHLALIQEMLRAVYNEN